MRLWLLAILCSLLPSLAHATDAELERVTTFLHKTYPGKTWDSGPTELESKSLERSYPGKHFFTVWSVEPPPPGAPPRSDQAQTYAELVQQWHATRITVVVQMDRKGRLSVLKDVNEGLQRAKTEADRKSTCAAVFSLTYGTRAPPLVVALTDVTVEESKSGWSCRLDQKPWFSGNAEFNAAGHCLNATRASHAPMPPMMPIR